MSEFCARYPLTKMINVVNEPLPTHAPPSYADGIGGAGVSGFDWVVNALNWAHDACPSAVLYINDYNTIEYGDENSEFIGLVKAVLAAGAHLDALGTQAHDAYKTSATTVRSYMQKLTTETGLPVYVSAFDIPDEDDASQRTRMQTIFPVFWGSAHVLGVTYWGFVVNSTWRPGSGLLTVEGVPRPALTWLMDYVATHSY